MDNAKVMLDLNNWQGFILILVALLGLFILVGNAIKLWRELKKPKDDTVMSEQNKLSEITTKLDRHEKEIKDLREVVRLTCQATEALLNHALHNGNTKEMEDASTAIHTYFTEKI